MQVNIFDYLPSKTFIYVDGNIREQLFNNHIGITLTNLAINLSLKLKNISRYKTGTRAISSRIFLELVRISNMSLEDFQNKIIIKVGKRGNKIRVGPYIQITDDWVYVSELIRGDGSLVKGHNTSYRTCFTNGNLTLIEFVKNFFISQGINDKNISIYPNTKNPYIKNLEIRTEVISYFLHNFFEIPFGYKKYIYVPKFMIENKSFSISAVRGIFDAEGSVNYRKLGNIYTRKIVIGMKDILYLCDIQTILTKLDISSRLYKDKGRLMYRLVIGDRDSILNFYNLIKPLHSDRNKKLYLLTNSYATKNWITSKVLIPKILTLLLDERKRRSEICKYLNITYSMAGFRLTKMLKDDLIKIENKINTNKGCWFVYSITDKGRNYLNDILSDFS